MAPTNAPLGLRTPAACVAWILATMLASVGFSDDDSSSEVDVAAIVDDWRRREQASPSIRLRTRRRLSDEHRFSASETGWATDEYRLERSNWLPERLARYESAWGSDAERDRDEITLTANGLRAVGSIEDDSGFHRQVASTTSRDGGKPPRLDTSASLFLDYCKEKFEPGTAERRDPHEFRIDVGPDSIVRTWLPKGEGDHPKTSTAARPKDDLFVDGGRGAELMLREAQLMAPLIALRSVDPAGLAVRADRCTVRPDTAPIGTAECLVLDEVFDSKRRRSFWLDPGRGYLVMRYYGEGARKGSGIQVDIRYEQDEQLGWVPATWTAQLVGIPRPYGPRLFATVDVEERDVPSSKELVTPTPPPGTWYVDVRSGSHAVATASGQFESVAAGELARETAPNRAPWADNCIALYREYTSQRRGRAFRAAFVWPFVGVALIGAVGVGLFLRSRKAS